MFRHFFQASQLWQNAMLSGFEVMVSSATVIQHRTLQMSLGTMRPEEAMRMLLEKPSTFAKSAEMTMRALAAQKGAADVALAAIGPIGTATKANARRLSRRRTRG